MVALRLGAQIGLHGRRTGWAVHTRGLVVGVGHARRGQFGQHRIQGGPRLRIQQAPQLTHPVGALAAQGQVPAPGPLGIAEGAVGIEQRRQPVGGLSQPFGPVLDRHPRQGGLGGLAGLIIHAVGQLGEEPADDFDVLGADLPGGLGGRHIGQARRQRLTGQRGTRAEILGLLDAPARLHRRDPQAAGQHIGQVLAPQFGR